MGLQPYTIKDLEFPEGKHPSLIIYFWASISSTIDISVLTRRGMERKRVTHAGDRAADLDSWRLIDLPLMVSATTSTLSRKKGELYVVGNLWLGGVPLFQLFAGYLHGGRGLSWPPGVFEGMIEGSGCLRSITGTDPAAGVEISETVPTNALWKLRSLVAVLVTDATVVNRVVRLRIDDGANILLRISARPAQPESNTYRYNFYPGSPKESSVAQSTLDNPLPFDLVLSAGWRIRTETANLQAGDDWGAPQLEVEEWIQD